MSGSPSPTVTVMVGDQSETPEADRGALEAGRVVESEKQPEDDKERMKEERMKGDLDTKEVTTLDDYENPKKWTKMRRWIMTAIISLSSTCVTFNSSVVSVSRSDSTSSGGLKVLLQGASTEMGIMKDFHISKEVSILSVSTFVMGLGLGPLLLGPLSEFYGRWKVYVYSYTCLFAFTWGLAFSPNVGE